MKNLCGENVNMRPSMAVMVRICTREMPLFSDGGAKRNVLREVSGPTSYFGSESGQAPHFFFFVGQKRGKGGETVREEGKGKTGLPGPRLS